MSYRAMPYVVGTDPNNGMAEVPTTSPVRIEFNTDIDTTTLVAIYANEQATGNRVPIEVSYKDRVATIRPEQAWAPGTVYRITVGGDDVLDPENKFIGIQSVLGYPMAGSFTVTFRTAFSATLPAPDTGLIYPADQSIISGETVTLQWPAVPNAAKYEVKLSQFNTLDPYDWSGITLNLDVTPDITLEDKTYYWQVRPIGPDGEPGQWCDVCTFGVRNIPDDPVAPGDSISPGYDDEIIALPEEIETYPEANWVNVSQNLRCVTAILPPGVNVSDEDLEGAVKIAKQDAFDPMAPPTEVDSSLYKVERQQMEDGSTMIVITLEEVI